MGARKDYLNAATEAVLQIDPSLEEDDVKKIISMMMKESISDPTIIMDNNVTGDNFETSLLGMCSWIDRYKPVISGNATFYCQPSDRKSPTSNMLRSLKKGRKAVKNQMFQYDPSSDEYQMLDLDQQNKKVIMNAEYGGSGTPTAAFYTKYSPAATTLMAQSIITTMAAFFEGFIGDNQKFFNVNECYDWMQAVLKKKEEIPKWVMRPSPAQVARRIKSHFYLADITDFPFIDGFVANCTEDQLVYLYYANNLRTFIADHPRVSMLIGKILETLPRYQAAEKEVPPEFHSQFPPELGKKSIDDYNKWMSKEMFLNPYKPPKCIEATLAELKQYVIQFVFVEYLTPDSIIKLNNHKRNTVLLVDTDSNIINADLFVAFILNSVYPGSTFGRPKLYNEMILVNVLAAVLDKGVANILDFYGRMHNMDDESRAELTMKNEFMFKRFFIMLVKKRYAASIVLREGNINIPFKPEIKGMDFIKAGVTDEVSERFKKMLNKHILFSDTLELHELMQDLKVFEADIYDDLRRGGTTYLKPQQYKAEGAYQRKTNADGTTSSKAWSLPVFRGSAAWNELYPDKKIYSLDRVRLIKLTVQNVNDIEKLKYKFPEEYEMIMNKIFRSMNPDIRISGLKYICIPNSMQEIPKWILQVIDYDAIISDVIASFRSVLDALSIEPVVFKTPSGNASVTSCLISL